MEKVLIGYPSGFSVNALFMQSMLMLQRFELTTKNDKYELVGEEGELGLYIAENRNKLVQYAQELKVDWLLQIDSDISFQEVLLRILMRTANKDTRPIVAGLYVNVGDVRGDGGFEALNCIYREVEDGKYTTIIPTEDLQPFEVDAVGAGILLCHMSVYDKLEYPYFENGVFINEDGGRQFTNEDIGFCRRVKQLGYPIWCDPIADVVHWKTLPLISSQFRGLYKKAQENKERMANPSTEDNHYGD
jgi:hypothetical protein